MARTHALVLLVLAACARSAAPVHGPVAPVVPVAAAPVATPVIPVTAAPVPDPPPLPSFFADDVGAQYPDRATVARFGPMALTADEPLSDHGSMQSHTDLEVIVLDGAGDRVRVLDDLYDVRIALYIARADLADRVIAETPLAARQGATKPATDGAFALGGAAPRIVRRAGEWLFVEIAEDGVRAEGWLPASALGKIYRPIDPTKMTSDLILDRDTAVKRADGTIVARLDFDEPSMHLSTRKFEGGRTREVEVSTRHLRVRGKLDETSVHAVEQGSIRGGGRGASFGRSHTSFVELPAGVSLHREPNGEVQAVTTRTVGLALTAERRGAWQHIEAMTAWGGVHLWIECPALRFTATSKSRYECTVADDPERVEKTRW